MTMFNCKNCISHHINCSIMGYQDDYCGCDCHKGKAPTRVPNMRKRK